MKRPRQTNVRISQTKLPFRSSATTHSSKISNRHNRHIAQKSAVKTFTSKGTQRWLNFRQAFMSLIVAYEILISIFVIWTTYVEINHTEISKYIAPACLVFLLFLIILSIWVYAKTYKKFLPTNH